LPYGIAKKLGGDTPAVDAKMDRCVQQVMAKGLKKENAIRVCKSTIQISLSKKKHG
jgi:hypothetical protein